MSVLYLIRHGQASVHEQDYDQLSPLGEQQAEVLGKSLQMRTQGAQQVVLGAMRRHQQTATACTTQMQAPDSAHWQHNPDWNEYDHQHILEQYGHSIGQDFSLVANIKRYVKTQNPKAPQVAMQQLFASAMQRWQQQTTDYQENWPAFKQRVLHAFQQTLDNAHSQQTLVFTSGGPISVISMHLLGIDDSLLLHVNRRLLNCGVTKLVYKNGQCFLASLNEHSAFEGVQPSLLTYS